MKFSNILFDWGDTLCRPDDKRHWDMYEWAPRLIEKLYVHGYRLGIVSNTHRYQDGHWVRKNLAKNGVLQCFEAIIASATYGIHKPDPRIFQKIIDFMQIDPRKTVMVGDSPRADGGCQFFGMTYFQVQPQENWKVRLLELLDDDFHPRRKLSNLFEFHMQGNTVTTLLRHLSEPLVPGDRVILNQQEYEVLSTSESFTKENILAAKDQYVSLKVQPVFTGNSGYIPV